MANESKVRRRAFIAMEVGFVALLGCLVMTSGATSWQDRTVHAGNNAATEAGAKVKNEVPRTQDRFVSPEGIPEVPTSLMAPVDTPLLACQGFDFEGGDPQGFTVLPASGLWHIASNQPFPLCGEGEPGHSAPFGFYYGVRKSRFQGGSCNYDTGDRNASDLISPSFDISTKFPPFSLGFNYLLSVAASNSVDTTFVDISTDGGTTWTQVLSKADLVNDNQWHNKAADITALVGSATSVRLRFRFDTVDNLAKNLRGWHVDDVVVCGRATNTCLQDDSGGSVLEFNSLTGAYLFRDCQGFTLTGTANLTVRGSITTLKDTRSDRRVSASIDRSVMIGTASIQLFSPARLFTIIDRNTADNTCICSP